MILEMGEMGIDLLILTNLTANRRLQGKHQSGDFCNANRSRKAHYHFLRYANSGCFQCPKVLESSVVYKYGPIILN